MVEEDERPNHAPPHERQHPTDFKAAKILAPGGNHQIQHQTLHAKRKPQPGRDGWPSGGLKCGLKTRWDH
jgi:hypothetical protein